MDKRKFVIIKEWNGFFNSCIGWFEKILDEVKECIFYGGLDEDDGVCKEVWMFLLGVYEWDFNKEECYVKMNSFWDEYICFKGVWWECMVDE